MSPGNLEFVATLEQLAVVVPGAAAILVRDERRLRRDQAARAWPPASRDSALLAIYLMTPFVLLVVPLHFVRTRRNAWGLLLGVLWLTGLVLAYLGVVTLTVLAIEGPAALY